MPEDRDYFLDRYRREMAAAEAAICDKARQAHYELAFRYSLMLAREQHSRPAARLEDAA